MALADDVTKLKAICSVCSKNARHSQRLINGKPAKYDDKLILVGAQECYEARCRSCFEIDIPKKNISPEVKNEKNQPAQQETPSIE